MWVIALIGISLVGILGWFALNMSSTQTVIVETPPKAAGQAETPVTGATSVELQDVAYDYDRDPDDASAQFAVRSDVNTSIWKKSTLTAVLPTYLAYSTTYSIGDTNPVGARDTTYVYVPVDASYAVLESELVTVTPPRDPWEVVVPVHNLTVEQNLKWTCYDRDNVALGASGNTSRSDYNLSLVANENVDKIYCYLSVEASDSAYPLGSILTLYQNDIENFYPSKVEFAGKTYGFDCEPGVPLHAQNINFDSNTNIKETGWKKRCDVTGGPLMLYGDGSSMASEPAVAGGTQTTADHQRVKVWFRVDTSGTDPAWVSEASTNTDMFCALAKDKEPYNKQRGGYAFGIADDSDTKADIGLNETDRSPVGKQSGFCTDGI